MDEIHLRLQVRSGGISEHWPHRRLGLGLGLGHDLETEK